MAVVHGGLAVLGLFFKCGEKEKPQSQKSGPILNAEHVAITLEAADWMYECRLSPEPIGALGVC